VGHRKPVLITLGVIVTAAAGAFAAAILLLSYLAPELVSVLPLGAGSLVEDLTDIGAVGGAYHFKPLLDVTLLFGAYLMVCLITWSQQRLASHWRNYRHFK